MLEKCQDRTDLATLCENIPSIFYDMDADKEILTA